ncbi:MAG: RHS repeat protein, partial [Myxococcales bacterium]|nr:RHS repeat protein [Myxococcales bacterium]
MRPSEIAHLCGVSGPRWAGDAVDVVTGANVFSEKDFDVPGPVKLQWRRNYDHRWAAQDRDFGLGFRHTLEQWLCFDVDGLTFIGAEGEEVRFPYLDEDGASATGAGFRLRRVSADRYELSKHAQPTRVFSRVRGREWPVAALCEGGEEVRVERDEATTQVIALWIDADRALRFAYDEQGHLVRIRMYDRRIQEPLDMVRYSYDGPRLAQVVDVYKQRIGYEYDALDRMTRHTDATGYAFLFEYDRQDRCVSSCGEDGLLSVWLTYRPDAGETELIDANGGTWLYEYDQRENLLAIVDPEGGRTLFERDGQGALLAEVDPGDATGLVGA